MPSNSSSVGVWSAQLSSRYQINLSDDLADWLDSEIWKTTGVGEYREGVDPVVLLESTPEIIWPALMPPDLLPLVSNMAGDWLCVRVGDNNLASEVIQWYHGGGDWIPWGRSLSEAIIFDAVTPRLPGPGRRHSIPAEDPRRHGQPDGAGAQEGGASSIGGTNMLSWALQYVPDEIVKLVRSDVRGQELADGLIEGGVAEVAVRCELVQALLGESVSEHLDPAIASQYNIDWSDVVQWMFDLGRMPTLVRQRLKDGLGIEFANHQNWDAAAEHCKCVTRLAPEHGWAWDILGYALQRSGAIESAAEAYGHGLHCSVFTDQSIRLRTHWSAGQAAKFSAARLLELRPDDSNEGAYLNLLTERSEQDRRRQVSQYWERIAQVQQDAGNWQEAHRCWLASGWDLGAEPMPQYGGLLERIAMAAKNSGWEGRAEVATTHRECLKERYRV